MKHLTRCLPSYLLGSMLVVAISVGCTVGKGTPASRLSGSPMKYWKADIGHNWAFGSEGSFREYVEDSSGRHPVDYGDFRITKMNFRVLGDSLLIYTGLNRLWEYRIISLTQKRLVVTSPKTGWGVDTLRFEQSVDQNSEVGP